MNPAPPVISTRMRPAIMPARGRERSCDGHSCDGDALAHEQRRRDRADRVPWGRSSTFRLVRRIQTRLDGPVLIAARRARRRARFLPRDLSAGRAHRAGCAGRVLRPGQPLPLPARGRPRHALPDRRGHRQLVRRGRGAIVDGDRGPASRRADYGEWDVFELNDANPPSAARPGRFRPRLLRDQ